MRYLCHRWGIRQLFVLHRPPVLQTEQSLGEVLMQDMIATVSLYAKDAGTRQGEG